MGEAKRRKTSPGKTTVKRPQEYYLGFPSLTQGAQFVGMTTRGAWIGIGSMVVGWATIRFIGPAFGWWQVVG